MYMLSCILSKTALLNQCRTVLAMAAALDWAVGTVIDAMHTNGQYDSTIIVYTSDNGAQGGQGGTSYPLRGTVLFYLLMCAAAASCFY
jgi:arylsulfatase A-like enzyme